MTDYDKLVVALRDTDSSDWKRLSLDAADAIEALQAEQKKTVTQIFGEEQQKWTEYCTALGNRIKELEQQMPKRGKWIVKRANKIDCSVCGHSIYFASVLRKGSLTGYNYCPNCGAKMEVQDADT